MSIIRITFILMICVVMVCKQKPEPSKIVSDIFCKGVVVETMNSNGYTYVLVKTELGKLIWAAAPQMNVSVGENVVLPNGSFMENFTSKTLGKKFPHILFVGGIFKDGENPHKNLAHLNDRQIQSSPGKTLADSEIDNIVKADGGYSVNECFTKSSQLAGKTILVRGKVVKFSEHIMGKNWVHIRDGSGTTDTNDLTVTTVDKTALGKTVLVSGKLVKDRNLGSGYHYPVILEEARIKNE